MHHHRDRKSFCATVALIIDLQAQGGDSAAFVPPLSVFGHFAERFMAPLVATVIGDSEPSRPAATAAAAAA